MHRKHLGFTLVELLVVIGIIALLVGILLPVLSKVRSRANRTACQAQLRDIGAAFRMYMTDSKGVLPLVNVMPSVKPAMNEGPSIVKLLEPQIKGAAKVFRCPDDRILKVTNGAPTGYETYFDREGSSYQYNPFIVLLAGTRTTVKAPYSMGHPELVTILDEYEAFHGKTGTPGAMNHLFADGHVGALE